MEEHAPDRQVNINREMNARSVVVLGMRMMAF